MKKPKPNYFNEIIKVLSELKTFYPDCTFGQHISTALDEYGDIWGISDKEILYALSKYKAQMQMDVPHETPEEELQKIIEDGMNLSAMSLLNDDYEDG